MHQPGITLRAGQASALTDTFTVSSADGATTTTVTITITGADDTPVITGDATGGVTEDVGAAAVTNILRVAGKVSISGGDAGENTFTSINDNLADPGSMGFNDLGGGNAEWVYQLVNTLPQIQGLKGGETLTNDYTIRGDDGARFTVTITITGADDAPTLTASTGAVTEDADADLDSSGKNLEATGKVGPPAAIPVMTSLWRRRRPAVSAHWRLRPTAPGLIRRVTASRIFRVSIPVKPSPTPSR